VALPRKLTQTFGGRAVGTLREFGGDKHTRFMLRLRLSLDCGYAAVATPGVSDNLFTVESLAALTPLHAETEACYREPARLPINPSNPSVRARSRSSGISFVKEAEYLRTPGGFFSNSSSFAFGSSIGRF
jgi:hypothetical protein